MSNPENPSPLEEQAALHALDLLDGSSRTELLAAANRDPQIAAMIRDYTERAALLAYDAPQVEPPAKLREEILRQLPARAATSKIISFPQWIPYAIAACLMILGICQTVQIAGLKSQLVTVSTDALHLRESNALIGLKLAVLETKDAAYTNSTVTVAWDTYQHRGVVAMQNLPIPPAGHDYQLWVLDPGADGCLRAGLLTGSRTFAVRPVSMSDPGFAVSLEPSGGRPEPTGPILFAVAPGA
jgi:anti-sigma-K factor RskA